MPIVWSRGLWEVVWKISRVCRPKVVHFLEIWNIPSMQTKRQVLKDLRNRSKLIGKLALLYSCRVQRATPFLRPFSARGHTEVWNRSQKPRFYYHHDNLCRAVNMWWRFGGDTQNVFETERGGIEISSNLVPNGCDWYREGRRRVQEGQQMWEFKGTTNVLIFESW